MFVNKVPDRGYLNLHKPGGMVTHPVAVCLCQTGVLLTTKLYYPIMITTTRTTILVISLTALVSTLPLLKAYIRKQRDIKNEVEAVIEDFDDEDECELDVTPVVELKANVMVGDISIDLLAVPTLVRAVDEDEEIESSIVQGNRGCLVSVPGKSDRVRAWRIKRGGKFKNKLYFELKAKFGTPLDTPAQREVMRRWAYNFCVDHRLRRQDIFREVDRAVTLVYIKSQTEIDVRAIEKSWFKTFQQFKFGYAGWFSGTDQH